MLLILLQSSSFEASYLCDSGGVGRTTHEWDLDKYWTCKNADKREYSHISRMNCKLNGAMTAVESDCYKV